MFSLSISLTTSNHAIYCIMRIIKKNNKKNLLLVEIPGIVSDLNKFSFLPAPTIYAIFLDYFCPIYSQSITFQIQTTHFSPTWFIFQCRLWRCVKRLCVSSRFAALSFIDSCILHTVVSINTSLCLLTWCSGNVVYYLIFSYVYVFLK